MGDTYVLVPVDIDPEGGMAGLGTVEVEVEVEADADARVDGPATGVWVAAFARRFCSFLAAAALRRCTFTKAERASTASTRYCLLGLSASLQRELF